MPTYCPSCGMNVETDLDTTQGARQWRCANCAMVLKEEAAPQAAKVAQPIAKMGVTKVPVAEVARPSASAPPIQIKPRSQPPTGRADSVPLWQQGGGIDLDDSDDCNDLEIERGGFTPNAKSPAAPAPAPAARRATPPAKPAPTARPSAPPPGPSASFGGGDIDFGEDEGESLSFDTPDAPAAPARAPAARTKQGPAASPPASAAVRQHTPTPAANTLANDSINFGADLHELGDFEPAPTRTFMGRIPTRESPNASPRSPTARAPSAAAMAALAAMKGGSSSAQAAPAPAPLPPLAQPLFETVVVCDDSELLREIVKDALEQSRICRRVLVCSNGEEFVQTMTEQLRAGQLIDLAVLDVDMPVLNGFYGAIALRAIERAFKLAMPTPLLFFSAKACDDTFKRVLDYAKPARYLHKGAENGTPQRIAARLAQVLATLRQPQA